MSEDPARRRFMVIQAIRWAGVALVILGLLVISGHVDLPREVGYVLFLIGIVDALVMPTVIARRWKSPPP